MTLPLPSDTPRATMPLEGGVSAGGFPELPVSNGSVQSTSQPGTPPSDTPSEDDFYDTFLAEDYEPDYDYPENPDEEAWWDYADRRAMELAAEQEPRELLVDRRFL